MPDYYHMYANGVDAKNFIVSEQDFRAAFNLIGVVAANSAATVVSFSIEDSHPHVLLWGEKDDCNDFQSKYQSSYCHHIVKTRGNMDDVRLECENYKITGNESLKNVAVYTILQPTKDGKRVMPFDYLWGSGSMYFRTGNAPSLWQWSADGTLSEPVKMSSLTQRQIRAISFSRRSVPDDWLVCNGFILPCNYVDVKRFEGIYETFNCYRAFLGMTQKKDEEIIARMAKARGILLEDLEARRLCESVSLELFGRKSVRDLKSAQRMTLALNLRRYHQMTIRQISTLARLPESEIRKYFK